MAGQGRLLTFRWFICVYSILVSIVKSSGVHNNRYQRPLQSDSISNENDSFRRVSTESNAFDSLSSSIIAYKLHDRIVLRRGVKGLEIREIETNCSLDVNVSAVSLTSKSIESTSINAIAYADAVYGIYKFKYGQFIALITKSEPAPAFMNPHARKVLEITLMSIPSKSNHTLSYQDHHKVELLLHQTFSSHSFYFSDNPNYDITRSYQDNYLNEIRNHPSREYIQKNSWKLSDEKFVWNYHLNDELIKVTDEWLTPVINAWCSTKSFTINNKKGVLSLISRRSRKRQGPRYLKRGSDNDGDVANFVTTEQILKISSVVNESELASNITSFTQFRGSIPLLWHQPHTWKLKPSIMLQSNVSANHRALRSHVTSLFIDYILPYALPASKKRVSVDKMSRSNENEPNIYFINLIDKKGSQGRLGALLTACFENLDGMYEKQSNSNINSKSFLPMVIEFMKSIFRSKTIDNNDDDLNGDVSERFISETTLRSIRDFSIITCVNIYSKLTKKERKSLIPRHRSLIDPSVESSMQSSMNIKYIWMDYHAKVKQMKVIDAMKNLFKSIDIFSLRRVAKRRGNDYFCMNRPISGKPSILSKQSNIIRTNCIDCLDRTNVVQTTIARWMIIRQLKDMGIWGDDVDDDSLQLPHEELEEILRCIWCDNGDSLSLLYAGTRALKRDVTRLGKRTKTGIVTDGLNSMVRYYLNNRVDKHKQRSLDIVIGNHQSSQSLLQREEKEDSFESTTKTRREQIKIKDGNDDNNSEASETLAHQTPQKPSSVSRITIDDEMDSVICGNDDSEILVSNTNRRKAVMSTIDDVLDDVLADISGGAVP